MKKSFIVNSVRHGALHIEVRKYSDARYGFEFTTPNGERIRVRRESQDDAETMAREMIGATHAGKVDLLAIDRDEFAEFLVWKSTRQRNANVPEIVAALLESKRSKGRSEWTLRDLGELQTFARQFPGNIRDVERAAVEQWLDAKKVGPRRWNNLLATIKALFRFARRDSYLPADVSSVEQIEKRRVHARVETYSAEELEKLLAVVPMQWRPVIVLGAFAGIRPEESCPDPFTAKPGLRWENILWDKRKIDVPREVAKDRRRRFVPICDALAAFLAPWRNESGPVAPRMRLANQTRHWKRKAGVGWKRDGLRHSYASYRLAITKDIQALALEMGNSARIIHDHYLDLKHEDEGEEWFAIRPALADTKIVRFSVER